MFGKSDLGKLVFAAVALTALEPGFARPVAPRGIGGADFAAPAPITSQGSVPVHSALPPRTYEQAAPVARVSVPPKPVDTSSNSNGPSEPDRPPVGEPVAGFGDTGQGQQDQQDGDDLESVFNPGDPGSVSDNQNAGTPAQPIPPFPQMGGISGGGGKGGGGGPVSMPQFQSIPQTGGGAVAGAQVSETNLTSVMSGVTGQMANALDGSRLTSIMDAMGKELGNFQTTIMGISQTNTKAVIQGLANRQNGSGISTTQYAAGGAQMVQATQPLSTLNPRSSNLAARTSGGTTVLTPRTSQPAVSSRSPASTSSLRDTSTASASSSSGQRAPLYQ